MREKSSARLVKATVFRQAAIERLQDAKCLHKAGRYQGAIYLSGYALECRLKFSVCATRRLTRIEESKAKDLGHDLKKSVAAAGLNEKLSRNDDIRVAFHRVNGQWSTGLRYSGSAGNERESESFINDTTTLMGWLETESNW
jgi:hypothetical protein